MARQKTTAIANPSKKVCYLIYVVVDLLFVWSDALTSFLSFVFLSPQARRSRKLPTQPPKKQKGGAKKVCCNTIDEWSIVAKRSD